MILVSDMGGTVNYGPIVVGPDGPVFHSAWEARTFAVNILALASACFNIDESRRCMEIVNPVTYLTISYYELWLYSLEELLVAKGIFSAAEYRDRLNIIKTEHADAP